MTSETKLSETWNVDIEADRAAGNLRFQSNAPMHVCGPPHAFPRAEWSIGRTVEITGSLDNDRSYTIIGNDWVFGCYLTLDPPPATEDWTQDAIITVALEALPAPPVMNAAAAGDAGESEAQPALEEGPTPKKVNTDLDEEYPATEEPRSHGRHGRHRD